ncbi:hypothetical protein AAJ76_1400036761 [Vairimorpha ceranae]|uniref:Uncharacterized protein n=1 Tax=Vairimorpha ceranae TaxID=40302 RepID=A0A0F9WE74_9MICR|nr:hypothetical protein AAJ76_1400036761 [Vairimorpha ceranae]KAF5140652.1 hypothetical protein G9O61_00g011480 [Vairimorpha ceranae]KKO75696.1 hypothetical protein AAJ76_1400036761 [Vairimorpha ceranae]
MIFFFISHSFASLKGELVPEGNKDLRLADTGTNKLRWVAKTDLGSNKDLSIVEYDRDKKYLKVNGKELCTKIFSKEIQFCDNKYVYTKWEPLAEDGRFKFKTEDGYCLSVGKKMDSFNSVILSKCKAQNIYQRFKYEKNEDEKGRIETIKNDYDEGSPVILNMALKAYEKDTPVEVIIKDKKDGFKRVNTTIGELNTLFAFNHNAEPINHDMLVDTTKLNQQSEEY